MPNRNSNRSFTAWPSFACTQCSAPSSAPTRGRQELDLLDLASCRMALAGAAPALMPRSARPPLCRVEEYAESPLERVEAGGFPVRRLSIVLSHFSGIPWGQEVTYASLLFQARNFIEIASGAFG